MKISKVYLDVLEKIDDWVLVSEWATRVGELHPDILEKANREAKAQSNETTGLREIAARIGSEIARGTYADNIEIDTSERPRRVRYISTKAHNQKLDEEMSDDIEPLRRNDIIRLATESLNAEEKYRVAEFDVIARQLKSFFGLDFEVDHATALLNKEQPGKHHPDNMQLILKAHNSKKNNSNWERFSLDDQIEYIKSVVKTQEIVAPRFGMELNSSVLESLIERLNKIYG